MPLTGPVPQTVAMQPALRHGNEEYHATIQLSWTPGPTPQVVASVRVTEGEDDYLRSLVVLQPCDVGELFGVLMACSHDLVALVRRSTDPFDDLV